MLPGNRHPIASFWNLVLLPLDILFELSDLKA